MYLDNYDVKITKRRILKDNSQIIYGCRTVLFNFRLTKDNGDYYTLKWIYEYTPFDIPELENEDGSYRIPRPFTFLKEEKELLDELFINELYCYNSIHDLFKGMNEKITEYNREQKEHSYCY